MTLITRPRCFGKTLNMSMLETFFSVENADKGDLFEGLSIWEDEKYRALQGTYLVISLSFARVKEGNYQSAREKLCEILRDLYRDFGKKVIILLDEYDTPMQEAYVDGYWSESTSIV